MKGGGFLVLLFLLICFLWGVTAVVGGLRRTVASWFEPGPVPPLRQNQPRTMPRAPAPATSVNRQPVVIDVQPSPAPSTPPQQTPDAMATTLANLREASQLHRSGVLTNAEFEAIKARLLKNIQH